ncbi:hypothetical protein [Mycobacteroides abscessus]|uniref:hypothetical protein n=1 Tax=Mycobacteroides abscessus TaxID=36809 RepID=UPI0013F5EDCD|nr:hypothetical protein [Mycobacteroides abscessus]
MISTGQSAMQAQKVHVAVEVSDLAATASAYFGAIVKVGRTPALDTLLPEVGEFIGLLARLSETPSQIGPYRAQVPSLVWRQGISMLDGVEHLDADLNAALEVLSAGELDVPSLQELSTRLNRLSRVFAELSRHELGTLMADSR